MPMQTLYVALTGFMLVMAVGTLIASLIKPTPYGRHMQPNQPRTMPARQAWLIFESPQWFAFALTFFLVADSPSKAAGILFVIWQTHYVYRAIVYPLHMRDTHKTFPVSGVVFGFLFNCLNGFINAYGVTHAAYLTDAWLADPRFLAGLAVFVTGWIIHFQSDSILIGLREDGSTGYKIPYGGLFGRVSCANYFGELVMWSGWALMTCTFAGIVFALFSVSNLLPRALAHHKWYLANFPDYPKDRKALIPYVL